MHRLGIQHWRWFRISREDRDLVLYLLDPEVSGGAARNLAFEVHQDGRLEVLEVTSVRHERRGWSWVGPDPGPPSPLVSDRRHLQHFQATVLVDLKSKVASSPS